MKVREIVKILEEFANPSLIDSWDNCGLQIGDIDANINKILISLDLDENVLDRAINEKYQMIVTHHPLIFKPIKQLTNDTYTERLIIKAIKHNIAIYSAHSNLDITKGGVNDELARLLGIKDAESLNHVFHPYEEVSYDIYEIKDGAESYGYGRIGNIDEINAIDFLDEIKRKITADTLIVYGHINRKISRVAVCGGSGAEFIYDAFKKGAQLYLTADIKYHEAQLAQQLGIIIVDGGHYHTEKIILPVIKKLLVKEFNEEVIIDIHKELSVTRKFY